MSYSALESSKDSGKPIFLYEFVQGENTWRFNSSASEYIWSAQAWTPSNISHNTISQSDDISKNGLSLKFSIDNMFANQFLGYAPDIVTSVTIYRGHTNDGDFVVFWKGRVSASKASGQSISIECESIFTSLRRPGLRARYQRMCRHALYSRGCSLNPEPFAVECSIESMTSTTLVIPDAGSFIDGYFTGGMIRATDDSLRLISNHIGTLIEISRPLDILISSFESSGYGYGYGLYYGALTVKLYPGCDHLKNTCVAKFNNLANYGGFPYIPTKNPFSGSVV